MDGGPIRSHVWRRNPPNMLTKIKAFIAAKPLLAAVIFIAIGGILALAFPAVARLLKPAAQVIPGNKA